MNRRHFVIGSGLSALASTRAFGANDRLQVGVIGAGGRMRSLLDSAEKTGVPFDITSVSDVYAPHREQVKTRAEAQGATTHMDFREVLDNKNVDAVIIATPDHWHVRIACAALAAGKDVYLEKPVTHTLEEGAALQKAVRSGKQVLQCGMQQRSWTHFRNAVELIQGGALGRVVQVRTYWWQNYTTMWAPKPIDVAQLDWKQWQGGAPETPFSLELYSHWRWYWSYGGGAMTDLFAHWIDVAMWAMKSDEPVMAQVLGDNYVFKEWQCPDTIQAAFRYPGWDVVYEGMMNSSIDDGGLEFRGTEGTLKITRRGMGIYREGLKEAQNPLLKEDSFQDGTITHMANFLDCIKTRREPNAPVEAGIAAARAGHIGNLAYHKGGQTKWPATARS
ncbi:MAG TPA: Gfo/Idh/MocA family oxidoreductase [Acidobacteriaceae bacterium]|jgi:predicted dehydrogenase|nr:Gfo/Idh/MocA family oxidoreductase [Acidobacteriaceae bacterium]